MNVFSFVVVGFVAIILLIAATVPGKNEPQSHRIFQLIAGVCLLVAALHIAGILP